MTTGVKPQSVEAKTEMFSGLKIARVLKKLFTFLIIALAFFSILPYLIPFRPSAVEPEDLAYANSDFAEISGIRLHYRTWGALEETNPEEPAVFLLHGFGASTYTYRHNATFLMDQGYFVVAADLPGFGLSERKIGYDHRSENRAADMWELLDRIEPGRKWHLVGHSMGGATVAEMALQRPEQVNQVVLAAGAVLGAGGNLARIPFKYPPLGRWAAVLSERFFFTPNRVEGLLLSAYGREPSAEDIQGYFLPLEIAGSGQVLADLFKTGITSPGDRLGFLAAPVLLLWGENDIWVPLEQAKEVASIIPLTELIVIDGEGHCPMETTPAVFNRHLAEFLK